MPSGDVSLEIDLRWRERGFEINIDYDDPAQAADKRVLGERVVPVDLDELRRLADDDDEYGAALGRMLFEGEPRIGEFFGRAKAVVADRGIPLHLRLFIDPAAPEDYGRVRWETLRDPEDGSFIATKSNVLFSRFLTDADWRVFRPPKHHDLRALVAIADPSDIGDFAPHGSPLPRVAVEAEEARARAALSGIDTTVLASGGAASRERILEELAGGVDILYLVCHGAIVNGRSRLFLEAADGTADPVTGDVLARAIADLERAPTIAVLSSCQSAGAGAAAASGDHGEMAPVGPALVSSGVAAVLAMQGDVTMATAGAFLTAFFGALSRDGVVDRAAAVARRAIRDDNRPDWWVPVLYSRLKRGRTYYVTGFTGDSDGKLQALASAIRDEWCTPVVGPGLTPPSVLPSRQEVAEGWVDAWQMPIAKAMRSDLVTVAQYLRVRSAARTPALELREYLLREVRRRYAGHMDDERLAEATPSGLLSLVDDRAEQLLPEEDMQGFRVLAQMDLPVYITTSWVGLLERALEAAGRTPHRASFDWYTVRGAPVDIEPPTRENPVVYHLFGTLDRPESLVLSGDDYFKWLTSWVERRSLLPTDVLDAFTDRSLLFLGYRLTDWDFQVLFQSILSFGGSSLLRNNVHVGVQLDPEGESPLQVEPASAQEYLESYLDEHRVSIFWGELGEFLQRLGRHGVLA